MLCKKHLLQRLGKLLFDVQRPYNHKAVLLHDNRNLRYLKEAFIVLGWSISASGILFSIVELLFEPPAPSSSAVVIEK